MFLEDMQYEINKDEVLKSLGYFPHKTPLDPRVDVHINAGIDEGYILTAPKAVYETYAVTRIDEGYVLSGTDYVIRARLLLKHLGEVEYVTLLVGTIGPALEERIGVLLAEKKVTEATILNAVGGESIEGVIEQVNEVVRREAALKKMKTRNRFSPGYGDWELSEQRAIMQLLKAERIGVTLTDACVMMPEKSVSAIIGWYR